MSGYGIDFMTGHFIKEVDARLLTSRSDVDNIEVNFKKPVYVSNTSKIIIQDVNMPGQLSGTVYFALVLYKSYHVDPISK